MIKNSSGRAGMIWFFVLVLAICVSSTIIVLSSIFGNYSIDDSGAIALVPPSDVSSNIESSNDPATTEKNDSNIGLDESSAPDTEANNEPASSGESVVETPVEPPANINPGFEASDDNTVWSTETNVEIFRVSYVNGEQKITVQSADGDKVIAPGTENSYTFKLKNTGNVNIKYKVEVDAYYTPDNVTLPIVTRLSRYDGKWISGSADGYVLVPQLNVAEDSDNLSAGHFTYYTLEWKWPFESGNDERDTLLGNMAVDEDLTFTIVIRTTAEADTEGGGILPPQTGDNSRLALWITIAGASLVIMVIIVIIERKTKRSY